MTEIGHVSEIVRYPVKSMAGAPTESALLGWQGLDGDRRLAFRRVGSRSGMPWLTASRLPELLLYRPGGCDEASGEALPNHVRTPAGATLELGSAALEAELGERFGSPVELMKLRQGIFDEAPISIIGLSTISEIGRLVGMDLDRRRFRANIVVDTGTSEPFPEDGWVGKVLAFGHGDSPPTVSVTQRDTRCTMINLDPDTAALDPRIIKTVVDRNKNCAGVYATVMRSGPIRVGDPLRLLPGVF